MRTTAAALLLALLSSPVAAHVVVLFYDSDGIVAQRLDGVHASGGAYDGPCGRCPPGQSSLVNPDLSGLAIDANGQPSLPWMVDTGLVRLATQPEIDARAATDAAAADTAARGNLDMACLSDSTGTQDVNATASEPVQWDTHLPNMFKGRTFAHNTGTSDVQICVKKPTSGKGVYLTMGDLVITGAAAAYQCLVEVRSGGVTKATGGGRAPSMPIPETVLLLGDGDCVSVRVLRVNGTGAVLLDADLSRFCLMHLGSRGDANDPDL